MKEIDGEKLIIYGVSVLLAVVSVALLNRVSRSRGKNPVFHGIFVAGAAATLIFLPEAIQDEIFSQGGVGMFFWWVMMSLPILA
jgi:fumarate reductase subunit D